MALLKGLRNFITQKIRKMDVKLFVKMQKPYIISNLNIIHTERSEDAMSEPEKAPLGQRIRDFINPALEDTRKPKIQNDILDEVFGTLADAMEARMEKGFTAIFNRVTERSKRRPSLANPMIIEDLTRFDPMAGDAKYSPIWRVPMPIALSFTSFQAAEIKELPNYIRLHEKARDMDVAIKIIGLTADESKASLGISVPAMFIVDASKSYDDGALENSNLYPDLPPKRAKFDKDGGHEFKF